jgi:predicted ABC-type ATPase
MPFTSSFFGYQALNWRSNESKIELDKVDIRRRFKRGLENLMTTYRFLANDWQVYDNQTAEPRMVAFGKLEEAAFKDQEFYASVKQFLEKK